jgi:hypothetical protein
MLILFPWLAWLAMVFSAVLLAMSWAQGGLRRRHAAVLVSWFLVGAHCQFFSASALVSAVGLALQTLLAVYLVIRWRAGG